MNSTEQEKKLVQQILEKKERGEKLTDHEERILAYSPYGYAARNR